MIYEHPIHKRVLKYSCSEGERSSTKTVSSYIYYTNDRGSENVKLMCGQFIAFGQIKYFITHHSVKQHNKLACVAVFKDVNFGKESGLWFLKSTSVAGLKFIHLSVLSLPLVLKRVEMCGFVTVKLRGLEINQVTN